MDITLKDWEKVRTFTVQVSKLCDMLHCILNYPHCILNYPHMSDRWTIKEWRLLKRRDIVVIYCPYHWKFELLETVGVLRKKKDDEGNKRNILELFILYTATFLTSHPLKHIYSSKLSFDCMKLVREPRSTGFRCKIGNDNSNGKKCICDIDGNL